MVLKMSLWFQLLVYINMKMLKYNDVTMFHDVIHHDVINVAIRHSFDEKLIMSCICNTLLFILL